MGPPLLAFCVLTWVFLGYWLDVYGKAGVGADSGHCARFVPPGGMGRGGAWVVLVFATKLDISRFFLGSFVFVRWFLLTWVPHRFARLDVVRKPQASRGAEYFHRGRGSGRRGRWDGALRSITGMGCAFSASLRHRKKSARPTLSGSKEATPVYPLEDLRPVTGAAVSSSTKFTSRSRHGYCRRWNRSFRFGATEEGVCSRIRRRFLSKDQQSVDLEQIGDTPLLTFSGAPADEALLLVKRGIDIVLAAVGIVVLSPLLLLAAAPDQAHFAGDRWWFSGSSAAV